MAAVLSLPVLGLGYFWDDFVFLTRVQANPISALWPEPGAFYRPISRALYFWPLAWLGSPGAHAAHAMNLLLAAASILLLVLLVRRLASDRAGVGAGLFFSGLAALPGLVAWASGAQDLLAITLLLAALHLRDSGRMLRSAILVAAALLSKETALCAIPALVLWDGILGRRPARIREGVLAYGALAILWVLIHPVARGLAAGGFTLAPGGHLGFSNLAVTKLHASQYLRTLFNMPLHPTAAPWPAVAVAMLVVAVSLALAAVWIASRREPSGQGRAPLSIPRAAALALLLAVPSLVLPAVLVPRWAAYFACMPALGSSILLGVALSRLPTFAGMTVMALFVGLGIWSRYSDPPSADALTEKSFVAASRAIDGVERAFLKLHPSIPRSTQVLLSVASSGPLGIDATMHDGQAMRVWYRDRTLRTLRPERRLPHAGAEYLFRITSSREVVEIDPDRGATRSSGGSPDPGEVDAITRTYARGLAASGETERAERILGRLAAQDEPMLRSYDLRLAAMGRMMRGDRPGSARILAGAPAISREFALYCVSKVMAEPTGRAGLDSCAYAAFGLSSSDPETLRYLMDLFYASLFVPQAVQLARRLQEVAPGDSESAAILGELR